MYCIMGTSLDPIYGPPRIIMCVDASQSTSQHSIMDDPEQTIWVSFVVEVLKLGVWTLLHGNNASFTVQYAQNRQTCMLAR